MTRPHKLTPEERLQLMAFVCSFAWADLEITPGEKTFVLSLAQRLDLSAREAEQVEAWLETPPTPDEVDPTRIPAERRSLFLETVERAVNADGTVGPSESESLRLFRELMR